MNPQMGFHYGCRITGTSVGSEYLWTPIILLNSPYQGSASGTSSSTIYSSYSIEAGPVTYAVSSSSSQSYTIEDSNGEASGLFELDQWTFYETQTYAIYGDGADDSCITPVVAEITNHGILHVEGNLTPVGSTSDQNEITQFGYSYEGTNYPSVTFHNGYLTNNDNGDSACPGDGFTTQNMINQMTEQSFSLSGTFSGEFYQVSGSLSMTVGSGTTQAFTYTFPGGTVGNWYFDSLNNETGSGQGAMAFYFVNC